MFPLVGPVEFQNSSGSSSPGRATASQAVGSGFESRLPLNVIHVYILYSELYDIYYIGQTSDLVQTIKRHNSGGEKLTSLYCPWVLKCSIEKRIRSEAVIHKNKLKNLNEKIDKIHYQILIAGPRRGFAGLVPTTNVGIRVPSSA